MTLPLLELKNVDAWYGATHVLHGVSMQVPAKGITSLLGANGAGKTTTLRAICNLMVRMTGQVLLEGEPMQGLRCDQIVRTGIAHVPDGRGTFVQQSVEENLQLGAYTRQRGKELDADLDRIYKLFPKLRDRRRQQAGTLSGGEQQMLAIGRALMLRPRLMLLDEPSFGLAPLVVKDIFATLRSINESEGVAMLLVEQNANLALALADTACLLENGRVVRAGSAASFQGDEAIRRTYLGY